jgi:hypothetical protein
MDKMGLPAFSEAWKEAQAPEQWPYGPLAIRGLKKVAQRLVTRQASRWQESCTKLAKPGPAQSAAIKTRGGSGED